MKINTKYIMPALALGLTFVVVDVNAAPNSGKESNGEVIFKIHDVVPEKNPEGDVIYCNLGATFFNRTKTDIANVSISLSWNDDVIGEIIDIEDREEREKKKSKSKEPRSRYSTSSFTSSTVTVDFKLPPIKMNQQISLKTKVDTNRCFILLNDMDVLVNNCGTLSATSSKEACANYFQYISPKNGEYYTEFKEISWENQMAQEDKTVIKIQDDIDRIYEDTIRTIGGITAPVKKAE